MTEPNNFEDLESLTAKLALEQILSKYKSSLAFWETGYRFVEMYEFRGRLTCGWNLDPVNATPAKTVAQQESEFGFRYRNETTNCRQLRKVDPLRAALTSFHVWFTGLRREATHKNLRKADEHRVLPGKVALKVNAVGDWRLTKLWEHPGANRLDYPPQYDQEYTSIECEPCTGLPDDPNNPRWSGKKLECGIHKFSEGAQ